MSTQLLSPGTMADDATFGTIAWTNPDNAKVSDNVYATVTFSSGIQEGSHYLKATNFGFSIPTGATINGILIEIERVASSINKIFDNRITIVKSNGSFGTQNKNSVTTWPTTEAYTSYGSSSDLWGETWTATDINDADFGVGIQAYNAYLTADTASVDHIRITVYYTELSGPFPTHFN